MYEDEDRVRQVNMVMQLANDIAAYSGADDPSQAEEAVNSWLEWGNEYQVDLPQWFDDHDRRLLVRWVAERLEGGK